MTFFRNRNRKKLLSQLKTRRHAEDDLLSPAEKRDFDTLLADLANAPAAEADAAVKNAEAQYRKLPFPARRGSMFAFLDLILVVGAVAFGLRGLFFQPFRIPTSSMQPTLYGIHYIDRSKADNQWLNKLPPFLNALLFSAERVFAKIDNAAVYTPGNEKSRSGMIFDRTHITIGDQSFDMPGNLPQVVTYSKLIPYRKFAPGEVLTDGFVTLGDHLFVERFSLYLSPPARGDVMVFTTDGLFTEDGTPLESLSGSYYIKRLAALPGDKVKIVNDQLYIRRPQDDDFYKIQDVEPKFRKIYSGKGGYHGHVSDMGSWEFASGVEYTVPEDRYLMLGDNSKFSMDSRFFGPVHRSKLVGRAWITFYPFSRRTGLIDRKEPLDVPTGDAFGASFPVMERQ